MGHQPLARMDGGFSREAEKSGLIEWRNAEEKAERFSDLAADLVRLGVDVLVTSSGDAAIRALKHATSTIPIVMAVRGYPETNSLKDNILCNI